MGKRLSKRKARISKSKSRSISKITTHEKKNLNHLVEVMKPRVYIIDPSNFKSLVQELTGNGITNPPPIHNLTPISSPSSISSTISQPTNDQQVQLMQNNIIVDQDYCYNFQESSPEWSFERSCSEIINVPLTTFDTWDSSEELTISPQHFFSDDLINQVPSFFLESHKHTSEELNMSTHIISNDMVDQAHSSFLESHEHMSFPQLGDFEYSWISEMNNPSVYNHDDACGAPLMPQEGCGYAYDISWIM